MNRKIWHRRVIPALCMAIGIWLLRICLCLWQGAVRANESPTHTFLQAYKVLIDPGHGGMDGGAQARDGTSEKDINLAISKGLKRRLQADGIKTVLTRNGDEGLYEKNAKGAIRTLKTQDMKRRKQIIEASGADLAVSIHLNSFTQDPSVCGAQVFYPSEGDPEVVAESKAAAKIRIFSIPFHDPAPAGIPGNIHHRGKRPF